LVEVLVALVILALAGLMMGYFVTSFHVTQRAQFDTKAQTFARSYFDTLRADWVMGDYQSSRPLDHEAVPPPKGYGYRIVVKDGKDKDKVLADCTYNACSPAATPSDSALKIVMLAVTNPHGRTFTFSTLIAKPTR
jgi:type II secretory pathway pseudopilin PulG